MPTRCCVPGCRSNYDTTLKIRGNTSAFIFPRNSELREKWVKAISRHGWTLSKRSAVCELHFKRSEVIKFDKYLLPDGTVKMIPFKPTLKANAVPSRFLNESDYLLKTEPVSPNEYGCREHLPIQEYVVVLLDPDIIKSYENFASVFPKKIEISQNWKKKILRCRFIFYTLNFESDPEAATIENQISVYNDLPVKIFVKGSELNANDLKWILDFDMKIKRWTQLQTLLEHFDNHNPGKD